jgi:hypothetical protein
MGIGFVFLLSNVLQTKTLELFFEGRVNWLIKNASKSTLKAGDGSK